MLTPFTQDSAPLLSDDSGYVGVAFGFILITCMTYMQWNVISPSCVMNT